MKKKLSFIALALAAGCVLGAAGCGGGGGKNVASLKSNWYSGVGYTKFQPSFTEGNLANDGTPLFASEEITYKVSFDGSAAANPTYTVNYAEGEYKTYFYATELNADEISALVGDYKAGYPQTLTAYYYKTELTVPSVTFTLKSDLNKTVTLEGDSIITECYFLSVADSLQPVYSHQTVNAVSPKNYQTGTIENAYVVSKREYVNVYSYNGAEAKTTTCVYKGDYAFETFIGNEELSSEQAKVAISVTENLSETPNSLFDVSSLEIAVRACDLSAGENMAQAVNLYIPWSQTKLGEYGFAGSTAPLVLSKNEDENKTLIQQLTKTLEENGLYREQKDENGEAIGLKTVAVGVGTTSGVSQTYWFTAVENKHDNYGHATMLKLSVPVVYGLGAINYTLKSIQSTIPEI